MMVDLFKKQVKYIDKEGKEKTATNFYLRCGDTFVPVEVKFFPDVKGEDKGYGARKTVLSAFASVLPDKEEKKQ
ncbi:MAG: hypothetical protein IJQ66_07425 [Clostridia bacterium]|nr:hypothetical protein [Clostridia bacterium]